MKLNAEQIIKALEWCTSHRRTCKGCMLHSEETGYANCEIDKKAFALIKELTEENERLYQSCTNLERDTRADTVRKMQERLIAEFRKDDRMNYYIRMTLDQIAKEMVEGK